MNEMTIKVNLLNLCPKDCKAFGMVKRGEGFDGNVIYTCKHEWFCSRVFESMKNQPNERDHITCGECRFYMPNINKCAGFTENPNEYFEMDRDDYCSQGQPILIIPWDGDNE